MLRLSTICGCGGRILDPFLHRLQTYQQADATKFCGCMYRSYLGAVACVIDSFELEGASIKADAWILRRLVSVLGRAARRPHTPRDQDMRDMFEGLGIATGAFDVPASVNFPEKPRKSLSASEERPLKPLTMGRLRVRRVSMKREMIRLSTLMQCLCTY